MYRQLITLMAHSAASGGAYPQFIAAGAISFDGADPGSISPAIPTHQADDIIIAAARQEFNDVISESTGWTQIASLQNSVSCAWFWKRASGSGTTPPTIEASRRFLYGLCYVFRGCVASGTPFENAAEQHYHGTAPYNDRTAPYSAEVITTGPKRLVTCFLGDGGASGPSWATPPPPSGWTALADDQVNSTESFSVITREQAAAATVTEIQLGTYNTSFNIWNSLTLAFIPA